MSDYDEVLGVLKAEASKRGWSLFLHRKTEDQPDSWLLKLIDTRNAAPYIFPYDEIVEEIESKPPDLGIHIQDGVKGKSKIGG